MENTNKVLYTVNELADLYKVHPKTVRRWILAGDIPAVKIGRSYRIPSSQLKLNPKEPN